MHMVTIPVLLHLRCCEDEEPEACIFVTVRLKNLTMCVYLRLCKDEELEERDEVCMLLL
jgi:hypothetical protein